MSFTRSSAQPQPGMPPPQPGASAPGQPGQPGGAMPQMMNVPTVMPANQPQITPLAGQPISRGAMGKLGSQPGPTPRFVDLLEQIRKEFISISGEASRVMMHKDEADSKLIHQHMSDLTQVRNTIFELDQAHRQLREQYMSEIKHLRERLDTLEPQPPIIGNSEGHNDHPHVLQQPQSVQLPVQLPVQPPQETDSGSKSHVPGPVIPVQEPKEETAAPPPVLPAEQPAAAPEAPIVAPVMLAGAPEASASTTSLTATNSASTSAPSATAPATSAPPASAPAAATASTPATSTAPTTEGVKPEEDDGTLYLSALKFQDIPQEFRKDGGDYKVVYNPHIPKKLDVELVRSLQHSSVVCCVRFSVDGKFLATGCNRSAQIYNVDTGELCHWLQDPDVNESVNLYIRSVCFSPDGKFLATGAEDHKVRVWNIEKREIVHVFTGHEQDIYSLVYSSNGKFVVSGSGDKTVKMWDVQSRTCHREFSIDDGVTAVALSPDDRFVAAGSLDKSVRVWNVETGELVERLEGPEGHTDSVYSVAYRPNGQELVSGCLDRTLKVWALGQEGKKGHVRTTIKGHTDYVLSVAVTPDSQWILSGSKDRTVQMWDAQSGEVQLMLQAHVNSVISVAPSPNGQLFASGGGDFTAKIWRYQL